MGGDQRGVVLRAYCWLGLLGQPGCLLWCSSTAEEKKDEKKEESEESDDDMGFGLFD